MCLNKLIGKYFLKLTDATWTITQNKNPHSILHILLLNHYYYIALVVLDETRAIDLNLELNNDKDFICEDTELASPQECQRSLADALSRCMLVRYLGCT